MSLPLVDKWNAGAEAAREGAEASAWGRVKWRPPLLKFQLWSAVASQLSAQGLEDPVHTTLDATPQSAIEAVTSSLLRKAIDLWSLQFCSGTTWRDSTHERHSNQKP